LRCSGLLYVKFYCKFSQTIAVNSMMQLQAVQNKPENEYYFNKSVAFMN